MIFVLAGALTSLHAAIATATFTASQLNATTWHYDLTLDNTGATNIGTFWFAWVPAEDFLPSSPSNVLSPPSWTDFITHAGPSDGYAILWSASPSGALGPGGVLPGFGFDSSTSPTSILGNSPFFPTPMLTSFVYSGGPFSDAGYQFQVVAAATPEPSTPGMVAVGALLLGGLFVRRKLAS
jgi:uncharacterized protein (TIGR03382 family)